MNTALNITTLSDVVKINCAEKSISRFGLSYIVKNDMYYLRLKDNLNFKGSKQTLREKIVERFNRVEIPYLIYNALISTIDRNGSSDCSFFGGAKHIIK